MKPYIYLIFDNKRNNICYVGKHNGLNKNYITSSTILTRYIKIWGINSFITRFNKKIIEYCTLERYNDREEYWVQYFNTFNKGLNRTKGGNNDIKFRVAKLKPVLQYDLNGNFIKKWNSMREAELGLNIPLGRVSDVVRGRQKSTRGFMFKLEHTLGDIEIWSRKDYKKRNTSPNSKQLIYKGIMYSSKIECIRQNNITEWQLKKWIKLQK